MVQPVIGQENLWWFLVILLIFQTGCVAKEVASINTFISPSLTFLGLLLNLGCWFSVCQLPYDSRVEIWGKFCHIFLIEVLAISGNSGTIALCDIAEHPVLKLLYITASLPCQESTRPAFKNMNLPVGLQRKPCSVKSGGKQLIGYI